MDDRSYAVSEDRWVVLGLAHPRAGWFSTMAKWSTAAAVPVDFVKCVSPDEVRARLAGGRAHSALLVGGDVVGLDRDLVDETRTTGCAVIVVGPRRGSSWTDLNADAALPAQFERADLIAALNEHAPAIDEVVSLPADESEERNFDWRGHLIAVTGPGGTGASTVAIALAQALGADASNSGMVLLADMARTGEQAMLHDTQEVVPGLQELTEAHRTGHLATDEVRRMAFDAVGRGYHLLLGLRRHRDWTVIRRRSFTQALSGLRRSYRFVVAEVDCDVEGEAETGSIDIEERNLIARTVLEQAELVLVIGTSSSKGVHALCRELRNLSAFGVPADRLVPIVNRAPRSTRRRSEITAALSALLDGAEELNGVPAPMYLPERRDLDDLIRDAAPMPSALTQPLHRLIAANSGILRSRRRDATTEPVAVVPGSLGSWVEDDT